MLLIKKYKNRKLYDTNESKYTTLRSIIKLINDDVELKVVDVVTGNDVTAITLTEALSILIKDKIKVNKLDDSLLYAQIKNLS